jgi:ATP-dependent helicase/nuclease subunit A
LKLVTKDSDVNGNLFMVGDVKQSIYRFRLAEPFLFLNKYKRFTSSGHSSGLKIDLSKNFRSRNEVLAATNFLFKQLMGGSVGEITYDHEAELKLGAEYPPNGEMSAEVLFINKSNPTSADVYDDETANQAESPVIFDQAELETVQLEARLIAGKIKHLIRARFQIFDRKLNQTRGLEYKDIVILMRSMPWAPQMMEEFKQQGIPAYADLSTGYFEATEVAIMLSLLRVIDNPQQDIHLASVLRSPIVGLDPNNLAILRIHHKNGSYYEALTSFMKERPNGEEKLYQKLFHFTTNLQKWRSFARRDALPNLIWKLYRETQFYDFVGGMPGGKQRQANLKALYNRAQQYESTSFRGLFKFLRFVDRMQDRGDDLGTARAIGEQEDVVRFMTIHKSKGLEFPVVFIAGLSKQFNMQDLYKPFLLDKDLGFASKFVNPALRISYPMLPQITLKQKMKLELIAEEMRVLYVALTRAKEKLFLVGTLKDANSSFEKWDNQLVNQDWLIPDFEKLSAKSYMDWIGPALVRHRDYHVFHNALGPVQTIREDIFNHPSTWNLKVIEAVELETVELKEEEAERNILHSIHDGEEVKIKSPNKEDVQKQLNWSYPHPFASSKMSKQTVSEIKRQHEYIDEHSDTLLLKKPSMLIVKRPIFMQEKALTSAERGTATHMVMQHIPFSENISAEFIKNLLAKMVNEELLTAAQADVIDIASILTFLNSDLGRRIHHASSVNREIPFSLAMDAKAAYADWSAIEQENVLIQGVIDCVFEDEHGTVLLDYKTDTISGKYKDFEVAKKVLEDRYKVQVELYAKALESIWKKPIKEKYLYFFDGGHLIKL